MKHDMVPVGEPGPEHCDATQLGTSLLHDFDVSVAVATWITTADQAAVTAARAIAATVDATLSDQLADRGEKTKVLYLVPHFQKLLTELKLTPASRPAAGEGAAAEEDSAERFLREAQERARAAAAAGGRR